MIGLLEGGPTPTTWFRAKYAELRWLRGLDLFPDTRLVLLISRILQG